MTTLLRITRGGEVTVYGVLALLGAAAAAVGSGYGLFTDNGRVGPGLVPTVSGALLALLGVALLFRALRERAAATDGATDGATGGVTGAATASDEPDLLGRRHAERVRNLWTVFGLLLLAILAVTVFGFLLSFGALILVVSVWVERRGIVGSLAVTVGACVLIYVVFVVFLRVPLPQGVLGF